MAAGAQCRDCARLFDLDSAHGCQGFSAGLSPLQREAGMGSRNFGRTLVFLGVVAIVLSMGWWASHYNETIRALGPKPALTHPLRCLLWTADVCTQARTTAAAKAKTPLIVPPYNPLVWWASLAVLAIGLVTVYRSKSTSPYPATPPGEPRLFVPKLEPFYAWVRDLSWPLIRVAVGGTYFSYGLAKVLNQDVATFAARSMAGRGLEPALPFAYLVYFLETGGALMVVVGLFTRFIASAIAIQFFIITFMAQFQLGYGTARGWNLLLMWGVLFFAIALRGGGPYSLDRAIGREL
jgi:putative oxidoreductase